MTDIQTFDFNTNFLRAILWQYDQSPNLIGLLNAKNDWYATNQTAFWQDWETNVFDLRTADQFGLIVWGIILGLPLYVNTPPVTALPALGFDDTSFYNFDNGNFPPQYGESYRLGIEAQRVALMLRYIQLTSSGTVPEINRHIKRIFTAFGTLFLYDYGNMKQRYMLNFTPNADIQYLLNNYDILPRPAGVKSDWYDTTIPYFGFDAPHVGFDRGNFGTNV